MEQYVSYDMLPKGLAQNPTTHMLGHAGYFVYGIESKMTNQDTCILTHGNRQEHTQVQLYINFNQVPRYDDRRVWELILYDNYEGLMSDTSLRGILPAAETDIVYQNPLMTKAKIDDLLRITRPDVNAVRYATRLMANAATGKPNRLNSLIENQPIQERSIPSHYWYVPYMTREYRRLVGRPITTHMTKFLKLWSILNMIHIGNAVTIPVYRGAPIYIDNNLETAKKNYLVTFILDNQKDCHIIHNDSHSTISHDKLLSYADALSKNQHDDLMYNFGTMLLITNIKQ